jgi:hypothetical protein
VKNPREMGRARGGVRKAGLAPARRSDDSIALPLRLWWRLEGNSKILSAVKTEQVLK